MFTITRALEEALLQHFINQKLEIAYAIHKPFPFFEGLRDKSFINEKTYRESLEACGNLVPISKVVHNILTKLEKTFNLSVLVALFSQINLREYPNLRTIFRRFKSVGASYGEWNRATPILFEAPAGPAEGSSLQTLLPQLPPQPLPPSYPRCVPRIREPGASLQQSNEILEEPLSPSDPALPPPGPVQEERRTPVTSDNLTSRINEKEESQEIPSSPPGTMQVFSDNLTLQKKDKAELQEMPHTPSRPTPVMRDDSTESSDPEEPQEVPSIPPNTKGKKRKRSIWSTPKKRRQKKSLQRGTASPRHGIQEKIQVMDQVTQRKDDSTWNLKVVTRAQKAKIDCTQTSRAKETSDGTSEMNAGKRSQETSSIPPRVTQRKNRKNDICSSSKKKFRKNTHQKEKPKDDTMDFHCSKLPVTCGEAKGILYKEKFKKGSSEKCIQNEKGDWLTPKEFEFEGKGRNTKNWKRNVHCRGKTLSELQKWKNSEECEVCCREGPLLYCGTCPRVFHEDCHIPPVEAERTPWSCTFCRMKGFPGSQQCHQESEVLERQMRPEEQLKCEFLLLRAYCHPQSTFFAEIPHNIWDYGEPFKEAMWLDLIKERLIKEVYTVAWFVRDMRLIFHNHKTFYKASDFGQVGLDLEAEFEKDLKEVFGFHEANKNGFRTLI
ncbi:sp110 nuclear body protein [Carlito syrichta]|uniref:Sp110 nuclear body protein n=1 Tax=Carlito syrichta TaxID=1868482 RepID=A0A1U7TMM5_CARSF|nr:sp110 nuclear body protein [Carlito syrichta]